jgi:hypothetical protein
MKLAEIPVVLERLRAGPQAWGEVECAFEGQGAAWVDAHARTRRAALMGLQYDRRAEDREVVAHLLQQELRYHAASPFAGLEESLKLVAYLAAELDDDVELAWSMLEAKRTNFDTACGFDVEALFCRGVERTWAMVLASSRPEREAFIEVAGNGHGAPRCTQDEVDAWWEQQRAWFPPRWEDEGPLARLGLCFELGDLEAGEALLRQWQANALAGVQPGTAAERKVLEQARSWWRDFQRPDEAAQAQARIDALLPEDAWERASSLQTAVKTYAAAGWIAEGLARLAPLQAALDGVEHWHELGLGRQAAEVAVDLALAALHAKHDVAGAEQAFAWAEGIVAAGIEPPLVLLEKLHDAATRLGLADRARSYTTLAQAERERIDRLLA